MSFLSDCQIEDPEGELGPLERLRACRVLQETEVTTGIAPSPTTVRAALREGGTLAAAARLGTLEEWEFTQAMCDAYLGCVWEEEHRVLALYDGHHVWVDGSPYGPSLNYGYHRCGYSAAIGFTVTVVDCYKMGDFTNAEFRDGVRGGLTLGDQFRVSLLYNGFPVSGTMDMSVRIDRNGCTFMQPGAWYLDPNQTSYCG